MRYASPTSVRAFCPTLGSNEKRRTVARKACDLIPTAERIQALPETTAEAVGLRRKQVIGPKQDTD